MSGAEASVSSTQPHVDAPRLRSLQWRLIVPIPIALVVAIKE
jgi:hypothetical protein